MPAPVCPRPRATENKPFLTLEQDLWVITCSSTFQSPRLFSLPVSACSHYLCYLWWWHGLTLGPYISLRVKLLLPSFLTQFTSISVLGKEAGGFNSFGILDLYLPAWQSLESDEWTKWFFIAWCDSVATVVCTFIHTPPPPHAVLCGFCRHLTEFKI